MPDNTIEDRIKMVLTREAMVHKKPEEISNVASLIGNMGLDSIQIVELITGLEDEFDISMEDEELSLELFENVNSLAKFIRRKLNG